MAWCFCAGAPGDVNVFRKTSQVWMIVHTPVPHEPLLQIKAHTVPETEDPGWFKEPERLHNGQKDHLYIPPEMKLEAIALVLAFQAGRSRSKLMP